VKSSRRFGKFPKQRLADIFRGFYGFVSPCRPRSQGQECGDSTAAVKSFFATVRLHVYNSTMPKPAGPLQKFQTEDAGVEVYPSSAAAGTAAAEKAAQIISAASRSHGRARVIGATGNSQAGEGHFKDIASVPLQALTVTCSGLFRAKAWVCNVPDLRRAEAVKNALEGPISESRPASLVRRHLNSYVFLDSESASLLSLPVPASRA
jgi:hypothetical protein